MNSNTPILIVHNGRVQWFIAYAGTWWKVLYKINGEPLRAQSGQYFSQADATEAAYRYAQD